MNADKLPSAMDIQLLGSVYLKNAGWAMQTGQNGR
jgi:hypothetical protein